MIRAILFDMVGVLLFKKRNYFPKNKSQLNAEKIEKLYNNVDDKKLLLDIKNKLGLSDEEIKKALIRIPEKYEKFEELWSLLPILKKRYKLAVINNGNSLANKYWRKKFDFSIFDEFIISAKIGIKKPDPRIYLFVCKKLKLKPDECLFLDDLQENIIAARKLKIRTMWWKAKIKKETNLKKLVRLLVG